MMTSSDGGHSHSPGGWWVMKFGGTSVAAPEGWRVIAEAAEEALRQGKRPLVVCSALAGVSNRLEELLGQVAAGAFAEHPAGVREEVAALRSRHLALAEHCATEAAGNERLEAVFENLERDLYGAALLSEVTPRLRARVLAAGELASTAMGAAILQNQRDGGQRDGGQREVRWHDARALLTTTGGAPTAARRYLTATCQPGYDASLAHRLGAETGLIHITQGFIAGTPEGETALLGRGGSDISAALFAEKLAAERLEIWSDVPGFFTADPRLIPSARLLRHIGYEEAQELASTGARVLHPRAIETARRAEREAHLRCTLRPEAEGTRISGHAPDTADGVLALAVQHDVTLITMQTAGMWQQVGFLADVFAVFKRHGLSIDLVSTSETSVSVTLDPVANALDAEVVGRVMDELRSHCEPTLSESLAVISLVGRRLRAVLPELAPAFEVLDGQAVHLLTQAASDLNLSAVVDAEQAERIIRELHASFFGAVAEGEVFGPTFDRVMARATARRPRRRWWHLRRGDLLDLAAAETPQYVYHLGTVREAARALRAVEAVSKVLYSVKANPHPEILNAVREEGLGFECVSIGEVEHVIGVVPGVVPSDILFTPNFAPREEYGRALASGAVTTVDNSYVLETWPELFGDREIFLRIDPGHGRGHHVGVRTAGRGSKFGITPEALVRTREAAMAAGARVVGLHAHLGSGITDPLAWSETATVLARFVEMFPEVRVLDLGGGLAAPGPDGVGFEVETAARHLEAFKALHPDLGLWLEPGRFLVAEAGVLLARVTQRKEKGDLRFVGVDAGMHTLLRPALYGAFHEIVNLSRLDEPPQITAEVVGPICETGDVLGHARRLPDTEEGDVLLIATAGAYGHSMASTYNQRPLPREAVLDGEV